MNKANDSFLTISDLWNLCVARWRWFVASIMVCLVIAINYILTAPYLTGQVISPNGGFVLQ